MNNRSLCSQLSKNGLPCGEALETENLSFGWSTNNLIYMDKIFSLNEGSSCPISFQLSTASNLTSDFYTAEPKDGCNCCCGSQCDNIQLDPSTSFNVTDATVVINSAVVAPATPLTPQSATVDGYAADTLTLENGQYTGAFNSNLESILNCKCTLLGAPSKAFFLLNNVASWNVSLQITVEGTVSSGSSACCFKACFSTEPDSPLTLTGPTSFAVPNVSVPCSVNGISPIFRFGFGGCGTVLNPELTVQGTQLSLSGLLIFEPTIHLEVTRSTLFEINAAESTSQCDQTAGCLGCNNALELDCQGAFDRGCGCGCGCGEDSNQYENSSNQSSCENDCCQCNGSNGFRW